MSGRQRRGALVASNVETRTVPVGEGRELCLELAGDPRGVPILIHNGTPNSRHLYGPWIADAVEKGIRLISYDRPGYGGSSVDPGHTVASAANDVRAVAQVVGFDRLGIWGISGGGPYAVASAALLSDLAVAVGVVASLAPYGIDGFDYFDGMGERNAEDIKLFFSGREAAVTMHGGVPGLAIEPWRTFDERFGTEIDEADPRQPCFRP